jgi:hypothetical protein
MPDDLRPMTPDERTAWEKSVNEAARQPGPDPLKLLTPEEKALWLKLGRNPGQ